MRRLIYILILAVLSINGSSQIVLTLDGLDTSYYDVPRTSLTDLTVTRSLFSATGTPSYILLSGDDFYNAATDNNLNGAKIIGNKFSYTGASTSVHNIMAGMNVNYVIKHNYIDSVPYPVVYKGVVTEQMTHTGGGFSYNIVLDHKRLLIKGINGVRIYNNTFYNTGSFTSHLYIYINQDDGNPGSTATGALIKNNIFYQKENSPAILVDSLKTLTDFECDYNIYYCEDCVDNKPKFWVEGSDYTWDQWRSLGYDANSIILDPAFADAINFVPTSRLDYGVDLGSIYDYGLSIESNWYVGFYPDTVQQDGTWQVGAVIYGGSILQTGGDGKILTGGNGVALKLR